MTGFTPQWLALRAPADVQARMVSPLPDIQGARKIKVIDLGAGTAGNFRFLAPRLQTQQHWTLVDNDPVLLSRAAAPETQVEVTFDTLCLDLAREPGRLPLAGCDLVTASALFDLVSREWIVRFAASCRQAHIAHGLFALNFDGRLEWSPREPEDSAVAELFLRDMRRDKGFGAASADESSTALAEAFGRIGYKVRSTDTPWRLQTSDLALQRALINDYAEVASDQAPERRTEIVDWVRRRLTHLSAGTSEHLVGHRDVLVSSS